MIREIRHELRRIAEDAVPEDCRVVVGSRQIDFKEREPTIYEFGLVVVVPKKPEEALDDFDGLIAGEGSIKERLETDRTLGGRAADLSVRRIVGPSRAGENETLAEWVVNVLQED